MNLVHSHCCWGVQVARELRPAHSLLARARADCHITAVAASSSNSSIGSDRCSNC